MTIEDRIKALDPPPEDIHTRLRRAEAKISALETMVRIYKARAEYHAARHGGYKSASIRLGTQR